MDRLKETWAKFAINEKIGLIAAGVCTLVMLGLLLSARDAIETVLPYVFIAGAFECVAGAVFIWNKNKRQAIIYGIVGVALCVAMCIMSFKA